MKFPFWYIGEKVFYKPDDFDYEAQLKKLLSNKHIKESSEGFIINGNIGFLRMPSRIKLQIDVDGVSIQIKYYLSLFESNIFVLLGLTFASFFYVFDKKEFIPIALFIGAMVYLLNTIALSNYIKNTIRNFGSLVGSVEEQKLWQFQQKWIIDPEVCSACGEQVNPYAAKCVNCGMHYKDKKPKGGKPLSNVNFS